MSDQKTPNVLKQSLLDQINADKKAVEALSDEELETVAGGLASFINTMAAVPRNINTGVVRSTVASNINTGVVSTRQPLDTTYQHAQGVNPGIQ